MRHRRSMRGWIPGLVLAFAFLARSHAADQGLEYKVKAGYLFNLAKLVEWPGHSDRAPIVIGVLDDRDALRSVSAQLDGKMIGDRRITVREVASGHIPHELHILLVTRSARIAPETVRADLRDAPILLVGETDAFAERGGTIGFVNEKETIRLVLNLERAKSAGLIISSKLASVARVVRTPEAR